MPKTRKAYVCSNCGQESAKWVGKCPACGQWNTFQEITIAPETRVSAASARVSEALPGGERRAKPIVLSQVSAHEEPRIDVCDSELNRVLGGGLVRGSLTLLGGEPGIGKSTLLLQTCLRMQQERILYVSGEESEHQIKLRADRIGTEAGHCVLFCETELERIFAELKNVKPDVVVIDSIQTIYTSTAHTGQRMCCQHPQICQAVAHSRHHHRPHHQGRKHSRTKNSRTHCRHRAAV